MTDQFPIAPPIEPMLAKLATEIPGGGFLFEPTWVLGLAGCDGQRRTDARDSGMTQA